ncbi:hypothetical protein DL93DRAFT_422756 [Clavulina sp. PMI_390]|nr:hypothetical protein DL93DRAFT_422756 [Clavulina sp. PMI_390]
MMLGTLFPALAIEIQGHSDKLTITTGSNTGIDLECAGNLAGIGCAVVFACCDVERADDAESVGAFGKRCADAGGRSIDISINNASMIDRVFQYAFNTIRLYELAYNMTAIAHIQLTVSHDARIIGVTSVE